LYEFEVYDNSYEVSLIATESLSTSIRNDFTGDVGMKITTRNVPITVTALGRLYITGNQTSHLLKIVDTSGVTVAIVSIAMGQSCPSRDLSNADQQRDLESYHTRCRP
jgi:hypothetical protein